MTLLMCVCVLQAYKAALDSLGHSEYALKAGFHLNPKSVEAALQVCVKCLTSASRLNHSVQTLLQTERDCLNNNQPEFADIIDKTIKMCDQYNSIWNVSVKIKRSIGSNKCRDV